MKVWLGRYWTGHVFACNSWKGLKKKEKGILEKFKWAFIFKKTLCFMAMCKRNISTCYSKTVFSFKINKTGLKGGKIFILLEYMQVSLQNKNIIFRSTQIILHFRLQLSYNVHVLCAVRHFGRTFLRILFVFMLLRRLPNDGTALFAVALCII